MTLQTVPRYDGARASGQDGHAIVVGASMAGMLAARVLNDWFERVTIVERDPLPDESVPRRGVPQDGHAHALLEAGRATLEDLFPGYVEDLTSAGGIVIGAASDLHYYDEGDFVAQGSRRIPMYCASRPLFEGVVRRRMGDLDGVTIRSDCHFVDYLLEGDAVSGVLVREQSDEESIDGDLVVDATGRTSRTPELLERHGYESPPTDEVHVDVAYSTIPIERPADDRRALFVLPSPPMTRGCGIFPAEDGRWLVTLQGLHGDVPPTETEAIADFVASLGVPELDRLLDAHSPVGEVEQYRFPSNVRRRYEDLDRFPDGLVAIGDAVASFNPIHGQGISVAALDALALHDALAAGDRDGLPARYFDRVADVVDVAWTLAVGADARFPQTEGPTPHGTGLFSRYISRLVRRAHADGELTDAFFRVLMMERGPTSLFRPHVLWRVLGPTA